MDNHVVVGVGNIYANEALFAAGIHPGRAARRISLARYQRLAEAVRKVLAAAIDKGGTTLRDFVSATGQPGYFSLDLRVYDRAGKECKVCGTPIQSRTIGQRNSFYCQQCQH
jgi:formamidopyrimidine-DNA glycosylase